MGKTITCRHSFNAGDLIASIAGFKKIFDETETKVIIYQELNFPGSYYEGAVSPIKDDRGEQVCMNETMFNMLSPLIKSQRYVEDYRIWKGEQVDYDFTRIRDGKLIPMPNGNIFHWPFMAFPDLSCDLSIPWIDPVGVSRNEYFLKDKIIINRTSRYPNPYVNYFFLKDYEPNVLFMGVNEEWETFNKTFDLQTGFLPCVDFLQAAQRIMACKLFIGNQSFLWHISNAIKKNNSILEACPTFPNCSPTTGGYSIVYQHALEYYATKLMNNQKPVTV